MIGLLGRLWIRRSLFVLLMLFAMLSSAEEKSVEASGEHHIPFKSSAPDQEISLIRVGASFALLIGLLFAGAYGFRYFSKLGNNTLANKTNRIKVLESRALPGKSSISLVQVDEVQYLVVRTHQDVSVVEHRNNDGARV